MHPPPMTTARPLLTPEEEALYRQDFLRVDGRRMLYGCGLGVLFSVIYAAIDFHWLGDFLPFYLLLIARGCFVAYSLLTAWVLLHSGQVGHHDRMSLTWGMLVVILNTAVVFSRPATFTHNVVPELAGVMLLYLVMPDHAPWRLLPPLALSASSIVLLLTVKQPLGSTALQSVVSAFVLANLLGIMASTQVYRYRRRTWKTERELLALAQQRQHMLAMKNRLIATLSHEFRSPLNVITSSSTLLGQYHRQLDDSQRGQVLGRMRDAIARLTEMLDEALFISRRDANRLTCRLVPIEVGAWLAELADELRAGHVGDHDFVVDIGGDIGECRIDPDLTRRIILNLVSNACKFTPAGGEVRFAAQRDATHLTLEVADRGCGIPVEEQAYVFEPFHRAANAAMIQGTGLGLSIVKETVNLLRGRVDLVSSPGRGTTVRVRLPLIGNEHD